MNRKLLFLFATLAFTTTHAQVSKESFDSQVQKLFASHFHKYKDKEYFSGASLSISLPNQNIKNFYIGQVSHDPNSKRISADTLYSIGSITKSFTAVLALQLEEEGKLKLHDTLGHWLPNYKDWSAITLTQLLNMTSNIPNYSDSAMWAAEEVKNLKRNWSDVELIGFATPPKPYHPPLKTGYFYSNTAYILSGMIIEKASNHSYLHELENRIFKPAQLENTFYPIPEIREDIHDRMAHGYYYNQYDIPTFVGTDVHNNNLSWAAAAGGVVSNSEDVIKWIKAIFVDNKLLNAEQKKKLMQLNSVKTNKPIKYTTKNDDLGFALGVAESYVPDNNMGRIWAYEGQTLGFRALYIYKECNGVIISTIFNSATEKENDHILEMAKNVYKLIMTTHPELICKDKI